MKSAPKGLIYTILADDKPIVAIETIRRLVGLGLKARSKGLMADPSQSLDAGRGSPLSEHGGGEH